jgi:polar amino acid transport system substrate-binding protein
MKPSLLHSILILLILTLSNVNAKVFTLYTEKLPPYSSVINNKIQGLSVDIITELFKRSELEIDFQILPLKRAILMTIQEPDSCVFPLERNQEREVDFKWVSPVQISKNAFYVLNDSPIDIRTLADVKNYVVGSYLGSATANYLAEQGIKTSEVSYDAQNIKMLISNRIDIWASDTLVADFLLSENGDKSIEKELIYFTTLRALACNLNFPSRAHETLENNLAAMYRDGTILKLMAKY